MKIVLVTGKLACEYIEEIARRAQSRVNIEIEVVCLPIPVAAMISAEYLKRELPRHADKLRGANLVIVPGYSSGDMADVSRSIGIEVVKGPRYAADIPLVLELLMRGVKLSMTRSADDVISELLVARDKEVLAEAKRRAKDRALYYIGDLPVSSEYPLVMAEVYVSDELRHSRRMIEHADIVLFGVAYGTPAEHVKGLIKEAKLLGKPVGIDTMDLKLVESVVDLVEVINAVSVENLDWLLRKEDKLRDKVVVLTTSRMRAEERVSSLLEAYNELKSRGFRRIVLDPVLSPPLSGLVESLQAYSALKRSIPEAPVLMGVGNVTELSDVDSIGLNALLAFIGVEIGVELFLTTEVSIKTRGCVSELKQAIELAILARDTRKPPKDFSINMLYLKSKKRVIRPHSAPLESLTVTEPYKPQLDPRGYFKIWVDHEQGFIILQYYDYASAEPKLEIKGTEPSAMLKALLDKGIVSRVDHAFYLGCELAKARIALKTGKEYEQDRDLF